MTKLIDFHAHILPGLDDGIQNFEDAEKVVAEARKAGFEKIICTTHYSNYFTENEKKRKEVLCELSKRTDGVELLLGNELYSKTNLIEALRLGEASTLAGSKYVLFEMPLHKENPEFENLVIDFMSNGYRPVLAHPERYVVFQNDPERIYEMLELGVLLQMNYMSVDEFYGSKCKWLAELLLRHNMISFLGTDVHRTKDFYPNVKKAKRDIVRIVGEEKFDELSCANPERVCADEDVELPEWTRFEKGWFGKIK